MFVNHSLIKNSSIESRKYQESILSSALDKNILCVLPTGLGKTPIAILLAAYRLEKYPESRILITAPTRPLVNQHYKSFSNFLNLDPENFTVITGVIKPEKREEIYKAKKIIFATPQTIDNDLKENRLSLKDFSLLVLDEVHHAIGGYSYPFIAQKYMEQAENPRILGLTASPGGRKEKIDEICKNAGLESIEIRTEIDEDVKPYIQEKETDWIKVDLPENFDNIRQILKSAYFKRIDTLNKMWLIKRKTPTKRDLLALQNNLMAKIKSGNRSAFIGLSLVLPAIKIEHAIGLLETQGIPILENYWKKIREDKGSKYSIALLNDKSVSNAMWLTNRLYEDGYKHPKISKLCGLVSEEMKKKPDSKIIIFASYRDTVNQIASVLGKIDGVKPIEFIGQSSRLIKKSKITKKEENKQHEKENTGFMSAVEIPINNQQIQEKPEENSTKKGLTQKEQIQRLEDFKNGVYNVLVCTSIGEEGLHVAGADLAIFYEPVPSEIRSIQRRGRVGRSSVVGKIIILMTKGTRDEAYYWSSVNKEKTMKGVLYGMQNKGLGPSPDSI